ncbi:MAG: hypothetical protein MUE69_26270 [Myxococcota bacterium]|jgi:hypothetical protein|nr:hypothetical protein [Myxococcota bacterium]
MLDASADAPVDPADGDAATDAALADSGPDGSAMDSCSHPDIGPAALMEYRMAWEEVFEREYPTASPLVPLGSFTPGRSMSGPLSASMYLAIEFTAQEGAFGPVRFYPSQPIAAVGYSQYRSGTAFVTVSPCPGDFRPHDARSDDVLLRNCRGSMVEGPLFFGNSPDPAPHFCQLEPGRTYFLNVVFAPPGMLDGVTNTCDSEQDRCEINAQVR